MARIERDNQLLRGFVQSTDGIIQKVIQSSSSAITFQAGFGLSPSLAEKLKHFPQHFVFSERSRIARLGVRITCEPVLRDHLEGDTVSLTMRASAAVPGYPSLDDLKPFFNDGLPVGRLVFCDPAALLSSDDVLAAIDKSELKLPASTTISGDGSILISPHSVICSLKEPLDRETLGRVLFREDGRELLGRYQVSQDVPSVIIPPGQGIITTCSMYLNEHYIVLQSGDGVALKTGSHFPATILDPIKTRGIRIYLEISNSSKYPIVNPLIPARVYRAPKTDTLRKPFKYERRMKPYSFPSLQSLADRFSSMTPSTCHYHDRPCAVIEQKPGGLEDAELHMNGPAKPCSVTRSVCELTRKDYSPKSICPHVYGTSAIPSSDNGKPISLAVKYFPNSKEHHDIIDRAGKGVFRALYFFEPSFEYGPFLSQRDHSRLQEYHAFGLNVYWVSGLKNCLMIHTIRDNKGYFVEPDRLTDFQKSMLFAFYGSNKSLSEDGLKRLSLLMDALVSFWGKNIGVVTGGGSGVMEQINTLARARGILSGANFLDITDQSMTTSVDFCQVFQSSCRHSRQKWFEVASFPIFNIGGLGSLEELGITLCNMKLSILEPVPLVLFDTENTGYWKGTEDQIFEMVRRGRAPDWVKDNIVITSDPQVVIKTYSQMLSLF